VNVLVTGATGFFGRGIVGRLRAAGHRVVGASRSSIDGRDSVRVDVTSLKDCSRAFPQAAPIDTVVHAAALAHIRLTREAEARCDEVNVRGTENILQAAQESGVKRFVFISSVMVYGEFDLPTSVYEQEPSGALGAYGRAKVLGEGACEAATGMDVWILRLAPMYDVGWLGNIRKRVRPLPGVRPIYVPLDLDGCRYSLCSLSNGAEAALWAVEQRLPPGVYNVADSHEYSQRDILGAVEQEDGRGPRVPVSRWLARLTLLFVQAVVPIPRWRFAARSRYWKYCERNVYSTDKMAQLGFEAPPDLLGGRNGDQSSRGSHPKEGGP
jgi:nucleoside-diphosphate-sugar epimerase